MAMNAAKRNKFDEIQLQHGNDQVVLRVISGTGIIWMCRTDANGFVVPGSREIIEVAKYPDLECLVSNGSWYPSLLVRVLRIYDDHQEGDSLPYFVSHHYNAKGRSLV